MSLKAFHILFIMVSTLLAVAFGLWSIFSPDAMNQQGHLLMGIASLMMGSCLLFYGGKFLRLIKKLDSK